MFITKDVDAAPHVSSGHGRQRRAAAARGDGAGLDGAARPRPAGPPLRRDLRAARQDATQWTPETSGPGFEFTPILKPLEPFRDR